MTCKFMGVVCIQIPTAINMIIYLFVILPAIYTCTMQSVVFVAVISLCYYHVYTLLFVPTGSVPGL